jgi:hypothetical protein
MWVLVAWALWFPQFNKLHIPWLVLLFWLCTLPITLFAAYAGLSATPTKGKWWILILTISVNVLVLGALT